MILINGTIQSIVFKNHTKQEAERWLKKYHYKIIKDTYIYLDNNGYIDKRKYVIKDEALYNKFYNKRVNSDIYFIIGYNSKLHKK